MRANRTSIRRSPPEVTCMLSAAAETSSRRSAHIVTAVVLAALVAVGGPAVLGLSTAWARASHATATVAPATTIAAAPAPLVGFNEQWLSQAPLTQVLTDADIAKIKATGATAIRFPVRCFIVGACSYDQRYNDALDFTKVTTWDFTQVDAAITKLKSAGITPVVGPHPGDRMYRPGYIVDDQEYASTVAFVRAVVGHLNSQF